MSFCSSKLSTSLLISGSPGHALIGDGNGGTGPDNLKVTALGSPSFELFSLVIGALDDLVDPGSGTTADFPQASADPAVSYRDTSLMNMPKSEFDIMINAVHPGVTTTVTAKSVKDQYQALINMAGDASPVEQVFWNFLADDESPVELSDNQLNAIAQAMSQADLSDSDDGATARVDLDIDPHYARVNPGP